MGHSDLARPVFSTAALMWQVAHQRGAAPHDQDDECQDEVVDEEIGLSRSSPQNKD